MPLCRKSRDLRLLSDVGLPNCPGPDRSPAMLKENGPAPDGKWADLAVLEPVRDFRARHASTLLTFDAVVDALDQIASRNSAGAPEAA